MYLFRKLCGSRSFILLSLFCIHLGNIVRSVTTTNDETKEEKKLQYITPNERTNEISFTLDQF